MNRFYSSITGSKTAGTRNRFLNIVSLMHCIICVLYHLYESLFVNNKSRNIGLKLMRLSFYFFIHSFIRCIRDYSASMLTISAAGRLSTRIKTSDICHNVLVIFRPAFVCLSVCLFVCLFVCLSAR